MSTFSCIGYLFCLVTHQRGIGLWRKVQVSHCYFPSIERYSLGPSKATATTTTVLSPSFPFHSSTYPISKDWHHGDPLSSICCCGSRAYPSSATEPTTKRDDFHPGLKRNDYPYRHNGSGRWRVFILHLPSSGKTILSPPQSVFSNPPCLCFIAKIIH